MEAGLFGLIRTGQLEQVRQLLSSKNIEINVTNEKGQTPLYWACEQKTPLGLQMVKLLIEHGAEVNTPEEHGFCPLHLACYLGNTDVVKLLLKSGAAVNATNKSQSTPLHLAAKNGYYDVVQELVEHGANVRAHDDKNKIPLAYAKDKDVCRVLQDMMLKSTNSRIANLKSDDSFNISKSDDETMKRSKSKRAGSLRKHSKKKSSSKKHGLSSSSSVQDADVKNEAEDRSSNLKAVLSTLQQKISKDQLVILNLRKEIEEEKQRTLCLCCEKEKRDTVLVPCTHLLYCWQCAVKMGQNCKSCGVPIDGMLRCNLQQQQQHE